MDVCISHSGMYLDSVCLDVPPRSKSSRSCFSFELYVWIVILAWPELNHYAYHQTIPHCLRLSCRLQRRPRTCTGEGDRQNSHNPEGSFVAYKIMVNSAGLLRNNGRFSISNQRWLGLYRPWPNPEEVVRADLVHSASRRRCQRQVQVKCARKGIQCSTECMCKLYHPRSRCELAPHLSVWPRDAPFLCGTFPVRQAPHGALGLKQRRLLPEVLNSIAKNPLLHLQWVHGALLFHALCDAGAHVGVYTGYSGEFIHYHWLAFKCTTHLDSSFKAFYVVFHSTAKGIGRCHATLRLVAGRKKLSDTLYVL